MEIDISCKPVESSRRVTGKAYQSSARFLRRQTLLASFCLGPRKLALEIKPCIFSHQREPGHRYSFGEGEERGLDFCIAGIGTATRRTAP